MKLDRVFAIISFGVFKIILFIITIVIKAIASTYPIFSVLIFCSLFLNLIFCKIFSKSQKIYNEGGDY